MDYIRFEGTQPEGNKSFLQQEDAVSAPEVEGFLKGMVDQIDKNAHGSVPTLALSGGTPPVRGSRELLEIYSQSPWLRAIINKVAKAVAATNWQLFVMPKSTEKFANIRTMDYERRDNIIRKTTDPTGLVQIRSHPILDLLEYGNETLGGDGVMQLASTYNDLVGEVPLLMEKNQLGQPVQLYPLPPYWIQGIPTKAKPFYTLQPNSGKQILIPITEIIWLKDPDPASPYGRGSGIAKSLGDEIEIDEYAAKHMKAFFYNRARPDIIVSGDNISPEDAKRLEQKWLENHQGFWKAFKPLFFSRKVDIKELTQSFEHIQMTNVRKAERDTFIQVFGAPPEKFGIVNESKRSTISAADYFFTKDVVQPRVEFMRRGFQRLLVPLFGDNLLLHYDSPVIQDKEFKLDVMKAAPWAYTLNHWRELSGHPDMGEDGEIVLIPLNHTYVPISELGKGGAIVGTGDEPAEVEDDEEDDEEDDDDAEEDDDDAEDGKAANLLAFRAHVSTKVRRGIAVATGKKIKESRAKRA
tara:strand:+ start:23096 stop:24667 length:1572 start_codon:yes stop_codon:yes gene_type:complete